VPLPNLSALASPSIHSNQGHPMHTSTPPRAPSQTRPVRLSLGATPTSAHPPSVHQASSATYFPHLCRNLPHAAGVCHATARVRDQGTCQVKFWLKFIARLIIFSWIPLRGNKVSLRSQCYLEVCRIQEERGKVWKKGKSTMEGFDNGKKSNKCVLGDWCTLRFINAQDVKKTPES
jgi:hypothetical protein